MENNKKLIVKSNYLIEASYKLNIGEQRVIYVLTSKINADDEEFKPYKLTIKEFTKILGTKHKNMYKEVAKYVDSLRDRDLTIVKEKSVLKTKWLSSAEYFTQDGFVELCFDPKLKPYLLQLKERFTKLKLENMVSFKGQYTGRIYELIKQYQNIGYRNIEIEKLKYMMGIESNQYNSYGLLKQRIISKAQKEINEKTDIHFDFEEIKTGRKITSLKFIIKSNINEPKEVKTAADYIEQIKSIFAEDITALEAEKIYKAAKGSLDMIKEKYSLSKEQNGIKSLVPWIIKALKEDFKAPIAKEKVDSFNDYEQRDYDFSELEKQLLGLKEC